MQAMGSTPLALNSAAFCTKPGRCLAEQVGVKAPGTENSTTFLPLNSSSVEISLMPSSVFTRNAALGTRSPTWIVMVRFSPERSEEHTSELQSLMRISYAVFCLKKKNNNRQNHKY